jgi:phytoene dehydrogenase-like protein
VTNVESGTWPERDAVIIGAGHNGLAAAVMLAEAGWTVTVLERNEHPGGAVQTAEVTSPGFRHDLMATNLNLFAGSPFYARYGARLRAHGLELVTSSWPVCSLFPDGGYVGISTDLEATLASIGAVSAADADAFSALYREFGRMAPHVFPLLGVTLPSLAAARTAWKGHRQLGWKWGRDLVRLVLQSPRELVEDHFGSREVQALVAAWGMHLDFAPDVSGGALFPLLETMGCQANGLTLGRGGAATMIDALVGLLRELGGEVVCDTPVERVVVEAGRAGGVVAGGRTIRARRAVIANVTPTVLFGRLVGGEHLDAGFADRVARYRYGPGTVMIHLALDRPAPWMRQEAARHAYVHIGPYLEDMSRAYHQAVDGLLPERPTLVVGQPTVVDPSRAPEGRHVLWVQARMFPGTVRCDAAGELTATDWSALKERVADRVLAQLEEYAPGLRDTVLARHVLTPADLEAINPNLVGGDSLGGSHHLMQHFFLRPFPGMTRYRTPIERLYLCGAATWPGAGVGAGSGFLLGSMLSSTRRRR